MTTKWNKVTEKLPEKDFPYLVWCGKWMIVSRAYFYDEDFFNRVLEFVTDGSMKKQQLEDYKKCKGYFEEFGRKYYFDDQEVYWAELPEGPK